MPSFFREAYEVGDTPRPPQAEEARGPRPPRLRPSAVGGGKTVECIAAVKLATLANDVFITGFTMSLFKVVAKCGAATLLVEETAHSLPIIVDLKKNTITITYKYHTPTAFFLYNYACYSVGKEKALLVY